MKSYVINTTEDGFSNIVEVLPADPVTGMIGIRFSTDWMREDQVKSQVKHTIFVSPLEFIAMSAFLTSWNPI